MGARPFPLTRLYERTNVRGRTYLTGRLGTAKLMIVLTDDISDSGEPTWQCFLTEGPSPERLVELAEVEVEEAAAR